MCYFAAVKVIAPTRIDLAGGTLDLYPLYLLEEGGITLNAAVDLCSQVELEPRTDGRIRIEIQDYDLALEGGSLAELAGERDSEAAGLILRVMDCYGPHRGVTVRTRIGLPAGSGLGGSSSLVVSLSKALITLQEAEYTTEQIIEIGSNLEAQSIGMPAGRQDFVPAAYGGFHAVWLDVKGLHPERLSLSPAFRNQLQERLLLGYSGASRFSGASNWQVLKNYIEKDPGTVSALHRIKETALSMYKCLKEEDMQGIAGFLAGEWENRRKLAEGVSTPEIERIFLAAREAGALASKVCGAGGGGCFVSLVQEGCRDQVSRAIVESGGRVLEYRFSEAGVRSV